jgi:hypothetical protein
LIHGGFSRQSLHRRNGDRAAGSHLSDDPGELLLARWLGGRWNSWGAVSVREPEDARRFIRPLPERREIEVENSQTRRSASSISRSTSVGGRFTNFEEISASRVASASPCLRLDRFTHKPMINAAWRRQNKEVPMTSQR